MISFLAAIPACLTVVWNVLKDCASCGTIANDKKAELSTELGKLSSKIEEFVVRLRSSGENHSELLDWLTDARNREREAKQIISTEMQCCCAWWIGDKAQKMTHRIRDLLNQAASTPALPQDVAPAPGSTSPPAQGTIDFTGIEKAEKSKRITQKFDGGIEQNIGASAPTPSSAPAPAPAPPQGIIKFRGIRNVEDSEDITQTFNGGIKQNIGASAPAPDHAQPHIPNPERTQPLATTPGSTSAPA